MLFISKQLINFGQIFLWLYSRRLVNKKLIVHVKKDDILPATHARLVISNHVSHLDPFIFIGTLSWKEMKLVRPMRPMLAKGYYYSPLLLIAYFIGCYPTRPLLPFLSRYAGTKAAVRYGKAGCTLGIYPEGRRVYGERVSPKYGVIKILEQLNDPDIYLVHIERSQSDTKKYSITIKRDNSVSEARDPQLIMDKIFNLDNN